MAREHYFGGREHAAIKHFFLKQYLSALCFKILQSKQTRKFVYIDGFTGPWGARDTDYEDTSFGLALQVLKQVKERLPHVDVTAVFCEQRRGAYDQLKRFLSENSGCITTKCFHGRFEEHIGDIENFVGSLGFRFAFIDPKGWNVDVSAISPLLKNSRSEVLFTFMTEFAGRFPDYDKVHSSYSSLFGDIDWKTRFEAHPEDMSNDEKMLRIFRDVLKEKWKFRYVIELPVKKPNRDRIFYTLVYGTRSPYGVLTFREAQARAEKEGHAVSAEATSITSGQQPLFEPNEVAEQHARNVGVSSPPNLSLLRTAILEQLTLKVPTSFLNLAGDVLEIIPAQEKDIKVAIHDLAREGTCKFTEPDKKGKPKRNSSIILTTTNNS